MTVRPQILLAGAALAAAVLSGCDSPTPNVTVKAGSHSGSVEAAQYCEDGGSCKTYPGRSIPKITVHGGDVVGIDVPRDVAGNGWSAAALNSLADATGARDAKPLVQSNLHYATFTVSAQLTAPVYLEVFETGTGDTPKGSWIFQLVPGEN